jgi:hypothetical protein
MSGEPPPTALGVYVSEQSDSPAVAVAASVQLPAFEKLPLPELEKLTTPAGWLSVPVSVSVTVAVQVVGASTATEDGAQLTAVDVLRLVTVNVSEPLLVACLALEP